MEDFKKQSINSESDNYSEANNRKKLIWTITGIATVLLIVILIFALSGESDYEKGQKYLKQKQYSEALSEFQKVEPGDKDFRMAQSKINYINGLRAYNDGLKSEAKSFLLRVDQNDEYYNESVLMIEKINLTSKEADLERLTEALKENNKDTVVIREKVIDTIRQEVSKAGTQTRDNKSKMYIQNLEKLVKDFESHYMVARSSKPDSKKEFTLMDSLYSKFNLLDNSGIGPEDIQLNNLVSMYMKKRMDYIQKSFAESSAAETTELKYLNDEGDKIYNKIISQINYN